MPKRSPPFVVAAALFFLTSVASAEPALGAADGDTYYRPTTAASPQLTFDEAQQLAVRNQPLIAAKRASVDASLAEAVAAAQLPDPRLKLALQNVPTNNFSLGTDSMTQRLIAVEQVVPREEKRRLKSERAKIEADVETFRMEDVQRKTRLDAALAWLNVYGAEKTSELLRESLSLANKEREALKLGYIAGKTNLAALKGLDVQAALVEDRAAEARGEVMRARAELARWLGLQADRELAEDFPATPPPKELKYLRKSIERNPEIGAVKKQIALAGNDLALSRAATLPDWAIEVGYAKRGPAYSDMVIVQLSLDLPLFSADRQDRRSYGKQQLVEQQLREHDDHERMLQSDLGMAYADWVQFSERLNVYERRVLPDARQRVDASLNDYRSGRAELAAILEAQRAETDARIQWLALRVKAAKARAQLTYLAE
jgi:outer membrane protein TolC